MNKIKFFKNNNLVEVNVNEISFIKEELTILKENEDSIISLNFKDKSCSIYLKKEKIELSIPVENMDYESNENEDIFSYTLVSEPDFKNIIIISKI